MIKIAHLTSVHRPFDTRIFCKECRTLAQAGYGVTLIVPHEADEMIDGVQIRAVPKPKNRWVRLTLTAYQVFRAALGVDAQVYHVHDPELLPWAHLLRMRGKRVIYDMHENLPLQMLTKPWIRRFLRVFLGMVWALSERPLLYGLHVVFAEHSYRKNHQWVKKHITILNMPAIDNLAELELPKYSAPTVGYIGGVGPGRGSLIVIEALHILKSRGTRVHFECIGPASDAHLAELERLTHSYALEGVAFRGYMVLAEGWRIIARCHIGLAIMMETPNHAESYPTKLFEYMAVGLPVITSHFPLYRGIVDGNQCGICIDPGNGEDVANAIEWLLDRPEEAEAMGKRGREAVLTHYNWNVEAKKLLTLYAEVLG